MTTSIKAAAGLCIAAGIFVTGYMANRQPAPVTSSTAVRQLLYYTCPMHPQYKSDKTGDCPSCGMRLVPMYADDKPGSASADSPGMLEVNAATQQLIGVRTDEVRRASASYLLRVPGRVTVDDARLYRIVAAVDGWVRELGQNAVGSFVEKDQVLASYYTNNLLAASQTLLFAMATNEQMGEGYLGTQRGPTSLNLQVAIDTLRSLGMTDAQIQEVQRSRQAAPLIRIFSPIAGFVFERNISPEQRFDKGAELYRIGDIGHVWVLADIFEKDSGFVKPGIMAAVRYRNRTWQARMSDALPQFDSTTRTLKTRFEVDNPGNVLRPGMFVDLELQVNVPPAVTVPADALVDTGRSQTVFVDRGNGAFEPRVVQTGWRLGDQVEITSGLEAGERIVISGNFLIDSERRMRLASPGDALMSNSTTSQVKDPVCGMDVDSGAPRVLKTDYQGKAYYFCSDQCLRSFKENPSKYVAHQQPVPAGSGQ